MPIVIFSHSGRGAHCAQHHRTPVVRPYICGDHREIALRRWRHAMTKGRGSTTRHQPNVIPCRCSASAWNLRGVPSDDCVGASRSSNVVSQPMRASQMKLTTYLRFVVISRRQIVVRYLLHALHEIQQTKKYD